MVKELEDSARDPEIQVCSVPTNGGFSYMPSLQNAIIQKITRERVGEEIDKMMTGMCYFDTRAYSFDRPSTRSRPRPIYPAYRLSFSVSNRFPYFYPGSSDAVVGTLIFGDIRCGRGHIALIPASRTELVFQLTAPNPNV